MYTQSRMLSVHVTGYNMCFNNNLNHLTFYVSKEIIHTFIGTRIIQNSNE